MLSKVCVCAQLCPTLCNTMDCSLPGSSVYGIFQARVLKLVAISYSKQSSRPRDRTCISCVFCVDGLILDHCATWEAHCQRSVLFHPHFLEWQSKTGSSKKLTQSYKSRSDRTREQMQGLWQWTSAQCLGFYLPA